MAHEPSRGDDCMRTAYDRQVTKGVARHHEQVRSGTLAGEASVDQT